MILQYSQVKILEYLEIEKAQVVLTKDVDKTKCTSYVDDLC